MRVDWCVSSWFRIKNSLSLSPQCTALSAPLTISEEVVLHSMELGERLASPAASTII